MSRLEDLAERIERLVLRHEELQRTNALLAQQVASVSSERDSLRSRLAAAPGVRSARRDLQGVTWAAQTPSMAGHCRCRVAAVTLQAGAVPCPEPQRRAQRRRVACRLLVLWPPVLSARLNGKQEGVRRQDARSTCAAPATVSGRDARIAAPVSDATGCTCGREGHRGCFRQPGYRPT